MIKKLTLLCFTLWLVGCASTDARFADFARKESLLLQTNNHAKLIDLYKTEIRVADSSELRIKLADTYLQSGDPESALFTLSTLSDAQKTSLPVLLIEAHALYEQGNIQQALWQAQSALELSKNHAELENLIGMIYAANRQFFQARHYFTLAREHLYDDITVKNNLAVIDILEKDYQTAIHRLLPLYLKGEADDQTESNLVLALVRKGDYTYANTILSSKYNSEEIAKMFNYLSQVKEVPPQVQLLKRKS
jgi:tight adherence protein D